MKVSNQAILIMGMLTTITGYLLLTDFQAIPYDPCTEYSPFHHPEITNYNESIGHVPSFNTHLHSNIINYTTPPRLATLTSLHFSNTASFDFTTDKSSIELNFGTGDNYTCKHVTECSCTFTQPCLKFKVPITELSLLSGTFQCFDEVKFCIFLSTGSQGKRNNEQDDTKMLEMAEINSITVLPEDVYFIARSNCNEANISGHQCHWIPSSIITKKECEDCQPICRSVSQTLTFAQFCLAFWIMIYSNSLQLPPAVALLSNEAPKQLLVS